MTIVQVDAFTAHAFGGNPAAVCVLPGPAGETWMQRLALEMNLSETAFLYREGDAWRLRWFTPLAEVDLCGHATLASAHVLWQDGHLDISAQARFLTRSGLLTADRDGDWIELDFPATPPEAAPVPAGLGQALGVEPVWFGKSRFDYFIELESEAAVRGLQPDFTALKKHAGRGFIVTAPAAEYDFVSRFFAPSVGIDEDPATGSAHCALTPYWASKTGKSEFRAFQASARGAFLRLKLQGDRVRLGGQAITVMRGELTAAAQSSV